MAAGVAGAVKKAQILQLVAPAVGLLSDMVDMGIAVAALDEMAAELADASVAGDHGEPCPLPRRGAVAPLG